MADEAVYYPTKMRFLGLDSSPDHGLKQLTLRIWSADTNEWMDGNQQILENNEAKMGEFQSFDLDIVTDQNQQNMSKWKQITQNNWKHCRLDLLNHHGKTDYSLMKIKPSLNHLVLVQICTKNSLVEREAHSRCLSKSLISQSNTRAPSV